MAGTKTYMAKPKDVQAGWFHIDATDAVVGRVATQIATILMGKHKPTYTPHVDTGDFVVVTNVEKVVFTGKKWDQKNYTWYTGYTGLRSETAGQRRDKKPEESLGTTDAGQAEALRGPGSPAPGAGARNPRGRQADFEHRLMIVA